MTMVKRILLTSLIIWVYTVSMLVLYLGYTSTAETFQSFPSWWGGPVLRFWYVVFSGVTMLFIGAVWSRRWASFTTYLFGDGSGRKTGGNDAGVIGSIGGSL